MSSKKNTDKIAFIIGNGGTRKNLDLLALKGHGTSFGCNLLFSEFEDVEYHKKYPEPVFPFPDYTISIEDYRKEMIKEGGFPEDRCIFPPLEEQFELPQYHKGRIQRPRSNAGMNAMIEAQRMKKTELYLIGFDFVIEGEQSISNMFPGKKSTRASYNDTDRRVAYFDWFAQVTPHINYYIVFPKGDWKFRNLRAQNLTGMWWEDLLKGIEKQ